MSVVEVSEPIKMFFLLMVAHAVADFGLQTAEMSHGKNRHVAPLYVPPGQKAVLVWPFYLVAHSLINGGLIFFVTGSPFLGTVESFAHFMIDLVKCENKTDPIKDQALHFLCKLIYLLLLLTS